MHRGLSTELLHGAWSPGSSQVFRGLLRAPPREHVSSQGPERVLLASTAVLESGWSQPLAEKKDYSEAS